MRDSKSNAQVSPRGFISLKDRIQKDAKGSLGAILILSIIKMEKKTWGYQIKKTLGNLTVGKFQIKDSSLYTILNNLEKKYRLIQSTKERKLRFYSLTELGFEELERVQNYWQELIAIGNEAFKNMKSLQSPIILEQ